NGVNTRFPSTNFFSRANNWGSSFSDTFKYRAIGVSMNSMKVPPMIANVDKNVV
ncbi:20730_t:CDS:2, partial [Gigaspora rosea]